MFPRSSVLVLAFVTLTSTPFVAAENKPRSITPRELMTMFDGWAEEWQVVTEIGSPGVAGASWQSGEIWWAERVGPLRIHTFRRGEPWLELSFTEEGEYRASPFVDGDIAKGTEPEPDGLETPVIREFRVTSPSSWSFRAEGRLQGEAIFAAGAREGDVFVWTQSRPEQGRWRVAVHRRVD